MSYNAEGKRVSKALNTGSPTRYFYEGDKAVFEYANGGAVTAFNVIGANLISRKIGTDKVYYFYNGHGDVTALLDAATKNRRAQYAYDAFGNITDEKYYDSNGNITTDPVDTIKSPIRYGEYQYDSETEYTDAQGNFVTGLYYLNARHYDPGTARFLEIDTYTGNVSDPLSLNLYTYCRNEPIMYTDPTGHYTQGKVFSYVEGQSQNPDSDVWELQQDLIYLGYMSKDDVPAGQEGYYGPNTVRAVNAFKNTYLPGGNKGDNKGKVGDTTWLFIKREVDLKNLEGMVKGQPYAEATAAIWDKFYSSYDKLISKPKSSSSTSGNTYDYGKDISSNQGTSKEKWTIAQPILDIADSLGNTLLELITFGKVGTDELGALALDMYKDKDGGYHARTSAWQQIGGYNDLYDYIFDVGTSMATAKFEFTDDSGRDYILWAWKGDYINLGAGAELGIYSRDSGVLGVVDVATPHDDHWLVDTNLAMPMTMTLKEENTVIANYTPSKNQWWITSFNPEYKNRKASELTAIYTVYFSSKQGLYDAFYNKYGDKNSIYWDERWTFDSQKFTGTLKF